MAHDPRLDELARLAADPMFVARNVTRMRAPLKERTMFGPAGRAVLRSKGERVIYGPDNQPLCRVIEDDLHNCQIEEDERLHAVVRPPTVTKGARADI
jgi:hypothetical protein